MDREIMFKDGLEVKEFEVSKEFNLLDIIIKKGSKLDICINTEKPIIFHHSGWYKISKEFLNNHFIME